MKVSIVNKLPQLSSRQPRVKNNDIVKPIVSYNSIVFNQEDGLEITIGEKGKKQEQNILIKNNCVIFIEHNALGKRLYKLQSVLVIIFILLIYLNSTFSAIAVVLLFFINSFIILSTPLSIKVEEF